LEEVFFAAEFSIGELEFDALSFEVSALGRANLPVRVTVFKFIARFSHILGRAPNAPLALLAVLAISCRWATILSKKGQFDRG
jgi:hypothetical protein